ncbi:uncharacterized protein LOC130825315 [Amaranthus tricolor]|uniref:uncharacterized protein LOC130825315 n=1 Tax=Amaranthus tricolor TaxID=29722 RepID=UPI002586CF00|nr:uncharacterized protein LOC130825315 [Amaranthus tricolor]
MDALWNLEDKLKISTKKSIILLVCTTILIIIVCFTLIFLKLKTKSSSRNKIASHDYYDDNDTESMITNMTSTTTTTTTSKCGMMDVRRVLLGSPCWSAANKWSYEDKNCNWKLSKNNNNNNNNNNNKIIKFNCYGCCGGSKLLPVWQRPILMGVKCKLPRFSGLILYDERGMPLPHRHHHQQRYQEVAESTMTTMLMDLL